MNFYKHAEWILFREEVIKLDNGKCVRCGRSRSDGAVLQVHHKFYAPGRLPWEYQHVECETLCKGCHAREHGVIMPNAEWILIGSDDLGDLCGSCEYCGTTLRHIYAIIHPKWGSMAVGTDCCDRLIMTKEASEYHEKIVKLREARGRFLSSRRWKELAGGWTIKQKGIAVLIKPLNNKFRILMNGASGKTEYDTLVDAKLRVFDTIQSGQAATYLKKRSRESVADFQHRVQAQLQQRH